MKIVFAACQAKMWKQLLEKKEEFPSKQEKRMP